MSAVGVAAHPVCVRSRSASTTHTGSRTRTSTSSSTCEVALHAPGDDRQLAAQVERIVSRPLDRTRPLWELYAIQGLEAAGSRC
jgi:Wax ester synthase-like Acyl-CoA acyltransferase domain